MNIKDILDKYKIIDITIDSRKVTPGFAFFAVKGRVLDGNKYIDDAIKNGAAAVFTDSIFSNYDKKIIYIKNIKGAIVESAAILYPKLPKYIMAVTGTNGKTSVVSYVKQLIELQGIKSASIGTLGVDCSDLKLKEYFNDDEYRNLTTLDQISLRKTLHKLADAGIDHVALEASSHGLDQGRMHGININAAAFTSFSMDHLDYHTTMNDYLIAKLKLFSDNLLNDGVAVINKDINEFNKILEYLLKHSSKSITVGSGGDVDIIKRTCSLLGQNINFTYCNNNYEFSTEIIGDFQGTNILIAAVLVINCGFNFIKIFESLHKLKAPVGRLERIGKLDDPYQIFIDYAHTPDALEKSLKELNKIKNLNQGKLKLIFGCGGDRDKTKREVMGKIASELADEVIITDDNPRTEDAKHIRAEILKGAKSAIEISDREEAINTGILGLKQNDILLIAGKGHEDYQIIGSIKTPFSDIKVAKNALECIKKK